MIIALIIADILMAATFFFLQSNLPPQIPLYYSRSWGEDQLADLWIIAVIPIIMHLFVFGNMFLTSFYYKQNQFLVRIMTYVNWFHIFFFPLIFIRILFLVS